MDLQDTQKVKDMLRLLSKRNEWSKYEKYSLIHSFMWLYWALKSIYKYKISMLVLVDADTYQGNAN